jgi:uncharacterized protein (TIGR03000 family)
MYSLVLMAAISGGPGTAGADQPGAVVVGGAPIVSVGCTGCSGCTGYSTSCHGYSSCHGGGGRIFGHKHSSCNGCCGGAAYSSCHGGGLFGHKHSCHGCCGGASCFGSCSGYINQSAWGNCCGGGAGVGYGYGGPTTYMYPSYSTPVPTGAAPYYRVGPVESAPAPVVVPPARTDDDKKKGASLKFSLPAGAALFVDGAKTPGEGAERTFFTPPLEAGQKFFYDVRAEVVVDGKTIVEEKRVIVEAGAEVSESFSKMIAAVATASNVAGK